MNAYDRPHNGYGVEAYTYATGWVLLDGIHRTYTAAIRLKQALTGQHGFGADDLRVVPLTITRKENTE